MCACARARARAHTHTHTHTQIHTQTSTHTYINFYFFSTWKPGAEYWCKSTRLQSVTLHHLLSYNITTHNSSYTVP